MPRKRTADAALADSIASNLLEALPVFPKRLLMTDAVSRDQHMPASHIQILIILSGGDMSVGELSDRLGIAKPNITPLVDTLRDQGLVERQKDSRDRRIVNVHLLDSGREKLSEIRASLTRQVDAWARQLCRSELKEFNNALASLLRMLGQVADDQ